MMDEEHYYRAALSNDSRFDGRLYIGVASTGIYCRPTCPAMTPKRVNMRFYRTAAAAQAAGFRACKRCRPDAAPGSPEWNSRADLVGRAMRLIADGLVDREGVSGLAARLNYSERQLQRQLVAEVGAGPLALARAQRARTAQLLLETTDLHVSEVAFASGYSSIRQFNDNMRAVFSMPPTELRARAAQRRPRAVSPAQPWGNGIRIQLPFRTPLDLEALLEQLGEQAVPGIEEYTDGVYHRALSLPHGSAVATLSRAFGKPAGRTAQPPGRGFVECELHLQDLRDMTAAVQRCRDLLDLDADPQAVDEVLARDPLLAPLVARMPGRRVPGSVDPAECAVRAVLAQDAGDEQAKSDAALLVARYGKPLTREVGQVTHTFPAVGTLARLAPRELASTPERGRCVKAIATALAAEDLVLGVGVDRDEATRMLLKVDGVRPRTGALIRMRALGDPDVLVPAELEPHDTSHEPFGDLETAATDERADAWRPWRSYAVQHLRAAMGTVR
ncbi:helix-turn-helix domain-containing protein [Streptomyces sp. NBC_00638]|uniref:DNA-3-methyladenine glycosylase 2 family protein n=1 Tax=unclassified Streptomyces TaxID=2593676 RepID=UPI002253255B|nr:AlkA N-terminal domain-containing protein [Streptomyces sp. NBC_00638]MCX5001130.1 helix-turn-helix domain-containing protein [Streptomyces sp. NBC_00638]